MNPKPEKTKRAQPEPPADLHRMIGVILTRSRLREVGLELVWRSATREERKSLAIAGFQPAGVDFATAEEFLEDLILGAIEESSIEPGAHGIGDLDVILDGIEPDDDRYGLLQCMRQRLVAESLQPKEQD